MKKLLTACLGLLAFISVASIFSVAVTPKALAFNNASECTTAGGQWQQISGAPAGVMACYCSGGTVISSGSCPPTSSAGCVAAGGQWRQISGAPAGVSACYCPNNNAITSGRCPTANPNPGGGGTPASDCDNSFLGLPTWHRYLEKSRDAQGNCYISGPTNNDGTERADRISITKAAPRVALAILDILLRLAGMVAFAFIIYSGFRFVLSQGDPAKEKEARETAINAVIGMVIAMFSVAIVSFLGGRLLG